MKKALSIILSLALCLALFAGCTTQTTTEKNAANVAEEPEKTAEPADENKGNVINPLPETIDINSLEDCTVAASLEDGDAYVDDSGKNGDEAEGVFIRTL